MPEFAHQPVMGREVVELLAPVPSGLIVDATVGGGGHARLVLKARDDVRVLGIDRDRDAVMAARDALAGYGPRARVVRGGFEALAGIVSTEREGNIVGILFDLGVSSPQLDRSERGFSYWSDALLDMRMDSAQELTAAKVVNTYAQDDLAAIIAGNGEERFARRIARAIVAARPLRTTGELVDAIRAGIPAPARRRGRHPARRTFQAIRMEVNRELPNLAAGLDESVHVLMPGGRILVIAYHSLEDRLVKRLFATWAGHDDPEPPGMPVTRPRNPLVRLLTRRPRRPDADEVAENPRSASARLRAVEKVRPS
ncbi:MAG TPA: 16S rRNA (cytosine(1402)-N(4))-methyltransferase RsmH [Acidimicrobiia bacterium]|nr:16S rRNA (cytosine(1402)-N(4))-methyltransferase RsmH [Acidimicrobiia bacterium]